MLIRLATFDPPPMARDVRVGLLGAALIVTGMAVVDFVPGIPASAASYVAFVSLLLLAFCIYLAILKKRSGEGQGYISFRQALTTGLFVSFCVGVAVGLYLLVDTSYLRPHRVEEMIAAIESYHRSQNAPEEHIEQAVRAARISYAPFGQLTYGIGTHMFWGLLISLVCAFVMKRMPAAAVSGEEPAHQSS